MEIRAVQHLSDDYWLLVALRSEVLRKPLGLSFSDEELQSEGNQSHFGIFNNGKALACMIMVLQAEGKVKMRQVCTIPNYQGKGLGKLLLQHCEAWAKENQGTYMYCHAREQAMPFYLQNAYLVKGDMFTEVGLPHFYLYKNL